MDHRAISERVFKWFHEEKQKEGGGGKARDRESIDDYYKLWEQLGKPKPGG